MENFIFITLTNRDYVELTLNCLKSLENINSKYELKCYCIDNDAFNLLKNKTNVSKVPGLLNEIKNMPNFRGENWDKLVVNKFNIIHDNLKKYNYVLFTDGDIVYKKDDFVKYCFENIKDNDMLIQNDSGNDNQKNILCSGFMFIKSNPKTLDFFNPEKINMETFQCDQIYINQNFRKFNIKLDTLPLNLFPNGGYYKKNYNIQNNYLIHFNWCGGKNKKRWIQNTNNWLI